MCDDILRGCMSFVGRFVRLLSFVGRFVPLQYVLFWREAGRDIKLQRMGKLELNYHVQSMCTIVVLFRIMDVQGGGGGGLMKERGSIIVV